MRTFINILFLLIFTTAFSFSQATTPQECVELFFEAFHKSDTTEIKNYLDENVVFKTLKTEKNDTSVRKTNMSSFYNSLVYLNEADSFKEEIHGFEVLESGELAQVMTPYTFSINSKVLHKGVNSFVLIKIDGYWKIIHLIDTRKKIEP